MVTFAIAALGEPATAAPANEDDAGAPDPIEATSTDPAVIAARRSFDRGTTLYETQRFDEAVDAFTEAFELAAEIADEELRRRTSSTMLFNLARVHLGAFSVDRKVEHLRQAENLLHKYRAAEQEMGRDPDSDVDLRRLERELHAALDDVEAAENARTPNLGDGDGGGDRARPNKALFWSGVGSCVVAGAGLGVMGAGLGMGAAANDDYLTEASADGRETIDRRGQTGNILAIAGGASAGVFAAVGTGLLVAAYKKADRSGAATSTGRRLWVHGRFSRDGAGVMLGGRF